VFEDIVKEKLETIKRADMYNLLKSQLLNKMSLNYFERHFFSFFVKRKFNRGDKIITFGSDEHDVFFLTEGEFELNISCSLIHLTEILKDLGHEFSFNQESKEYNLINNNQTFKSFMHEKRLFKLLIMKDNDIVGLKDIVINNKFICNVECLTTKGEAFSIEKKVTYIINKYTELIIYNILIEFCLLFLNYN